MADGTDGGGGREPADVTAEDTVADAEHTDAEPTGVERPDADGRAPDRLETWALATFAVVTLGLVLVLGGHLRNGLAGPLSDIGTVTGILLFGYLWALSVVGVRWALGDGGLRGLRAAGPLHLVGRGAGAGAIVGGGFVLGVLVVVLGGSFLTGEFPVVGLALYGGIGTAVGAIVGGVVGVVFAAIAAGFSATSDAVVGGLSEE